MDKGNDTVIESWDVEGDMDTVRRRWAEFTQALRYVPGPSNGSSGTWLSWARPETEGEEQIVFVAEGPELTRVNVAMRYDEEALREEGETYDDVARRMHQDMALFKDYVEGRLPEDWPARKAG